MRIGREEGAHVVSTLQRPSDARPHVIALAGHSPQATLFAVYTFAEEALGAQVNPDYVSSLRIMEEVARTRIGPGFELSAARIFLRDSTGNFAPAYILDIVSAGWK